MFRNKVGLDISSEDRWEDLANSYADNIEGVYHSHRLTMIRHLIGTEAIAGKRVVDFGCGEGIFTEELAKQGAQVLGCDPCEQLVKMANHRIESYGPLASNVQGGVEELGNCESSSIDVLFALNVLAYLTDTEERKFYEHAKRIIRPNGVLIVTHSNELFDMYTLNRFTVEFYREHFSFTGIDTSVAQLLTNPDEPKRSSFNVRENPLAYKYKLADFGFKETQQEFANFHPFPPLLMDVEDFDEINSREYADTLNWRVRDRWKLMFMCSMFGSRSLRCER